jgi:tRNA (guanosine-2'-O-)-methyltransferase
VKQLDGTGLKRLHREWRRRTTTRVAMVLDGVQSPYNVGSIIRTAAAYRVERIWLAGVTPALDSSSARKASMGCERYLEWSSVAKAVDAVGAAREDGYRVVAIELTDGARPLHEIGTTGEVCLVVGHEDHGVASATLAACDEVAYLPQLGRVGSLNVASATAIALYELRRQEWTA